MTFVSLSFGCSSFVQGFTFLIPVNGSAEVPVRD
jgi:hypothetical protein